MTTRHLVSLVTGVLILSVLFPIGLSLWLAHRQVEKRFNEELDIFSSRVALRTERVSDQAKAALTHIASFKGEPCSSAHLLAMRRVSYSFRYVQEVLYLKNSIPVCSSLEKESHIPAFPPPMKITRDGYRAWFTAQNDLGIKRYMAALGSDSYIVMIDPASFIDVIPFGAWPIDVAIIGRERNTVVASSGNLDPAILPLIHHETPLRLENRGIQYAIHPFPEMGITIVMLGTDRSAGKELVSTGVYLATGGHRNGSAGCGLYSAYFASATVAPPPSPGCDRQSRN